MGKTKKVYHGNCWPKAKHLWLMQAALLDGDSALNALEKWSAQLDVDKLDYPSYQIIPKLYKNLMRLNVSHANMKIFEGVYRRTWVENQRNFYRFSHLAQHLRENGVEDIVLLKGGAMMLSYYKDFGIRQMGDIDFLVAKESAFKTMLLLLDLGFQIDPPSLYTNVACLEDKIKMQHSLNFVGTCSKYNKLCIDLHWSILYEIPSYAIDSNWIYNADIRTLYDVKVATLNSTDLLYQTCIHGTRYSAVPLIRWVMDAVSLINLNIDKINWQDIIKQARRDRQLLVIRDTFSYLIEYFNAPIPVDIVDELKKFVLVEQLYFAFKRNAFLSLLLIPSRLWAEHSRTMPASGIFLRLFTLPRYLQKKCGLAQLWHLPFYLPIKIVATVKKRF